MSTHVTSHAVNSYCELYTYVGESKVKEKHEMNFLSSIVQKKNLYAQKD